MKKKELEIKLQQIPNFKNPNPKLEQYLTPATIAADILFTAFQFGDIENKIVIDLGCGTGIFSIGAKMIGAKRVVGVDISKEGIVIAKNFAEKNNLDIEFYTKDVTDFDIKCDTTIMNPPFGAQKSNQKADRKFIEKGFEISNIIYSLHLSKTIPFIEKMVNSLNGEISFSKKYVFPIKHIFEFHDKELVKYDVTLIRVITKR